MPADAEPTRTRTSWHAVARCATCDWSAEMTGDSDVEVAVFLRRLLMEHVALTHAKQRSTVQ